MTLTDMITPDIAPLLPTDAVVQARGHALAAELGRRSSPRTRARPGRAPLVRLAAALGAVVVISGAGALGLFDGDATSQAQAFPVFNTPHVSPQSIGESILGSFLKSEGEVPGNPPNPSAPNGPYWADAASHAYAFTTYWGTAYTFKKYDRATGYTVCSVYPDYQTPVVPWHGGWVGGCRTAPTLAEAAAGWETIPDPNGIEFVQLVPAGTTAEVRVGSAAATAVPIRDGVLSIRVTSAATLTVHAGGSTETHQLEPGVPTQPGTKASSAQGRAAAHR
jgi:hypothetical protein